MQPRKNIITVINRFSRDTLARPRAVLYFSSSAKDAINLKWGYYYPPPFVYEVRNKEAQQVESLKSQRAIHAVLGWERQVNQKLSLQVESYYKLLDNIIPYYHDQLQLIYSNANSHEGFAYGLDLSLQGEIVDGIDSWLSYSYLKARERIIGTSNYQRRPLDQTHTIRLFLQDKMPRFPNSQAHMRILFGSGFLFHPRRAVTDEATGLSTLEIDFDDREQFRYYFRMDLGLLAKVELGGGRTLAIAGEILNVWNVLNVADYTWFQVPQVRSTPIRVPQVLTRRFFNLGFELQL